MLYCDREGFLNMFGYRKRKKMKKQGKPARQAGRKIMVSSACSVMLSMTAVFCMSAYADIAQGTDETNASKTGSESVLHENEALKWEQPGLYRLMYGMEGPRRYAYTVRDDEEHTEKETEEEVQTEREHLSLEDEPPVFITGEGDDGDFVLDEEYINSYELAQCSDIIFFGDSRVVGMSMSAGGYHYIGKVSMGYQWTATEGLKLLEEKMAEYPQADIVMCMGINDPGNIGAYIGFYRSLAARCPDRRFWYLSVNPVSERLAAAHGYSIRNSMIEGFNSQLSAAFPDRYIDCYTYLTENGIGTGDGVHYAGNTYIAVQDFTWRAISARLDEENRARG